LDACPVPIVRSCLPPLRLPADLGRIVRDERKIDRYAQVFLPGSPILDRRYLFGREQELTDLRNVLARPGQHAIVIGDRGVGKTSLAKQALRESELKAVWRTCDTKSSFHVVFHDLLKDCGVDFRDHEYTAEEATRGTLKGAPFGIGAAAEHTSARSEKYTTSQQAELTPWAVFKALEDLGSKFILILDEYDAVHRVRTADDFHENTAYAMKHLSDHNERCDCRIVVVGVAASSNELLGKHESIQRSAREIYLRPLRREDIFDFLNTAEADLGVAFDARVKQRLAYGSLGYPYFVHLVGLQCIEAMLARDRNARVVAWSDFAVGVDRAVEHAFRAELSKYREAYRRASVVERAVIDTLAVMRTPHPKRGTLRKAVADKYRIEPPAFEQALNRLTQEDRFLYMSRRSDEVRFLDPLMKPFIRERILLHGQEVADGQGELFGGETREES
jgi:putative ATPase